MTLLKSIPHWAFTPLIFLILALFFRFALRGYDYIAYSFTFFAILYVVMRFAPAGLRRVIIILVGLGLIYFFAVEIPIIKNSSTDKEPARKYLIVLGAAVHDDVPSLSLQHRLEGALDYMEKYPESIAILSGGKGQGEKISEAECMYEWLLSNNIPAQRLITEDRAISTAENLRFSFDIIEKRGDNPDNNVAIVSSPYHLYRAKSMARLLGVDAAGVAGNWGYPIYMLNCYIREAFGITHLWVFGI